ncbi:hypothetical protein G6045_14245 [Streptomyces sp. YC504]|uniref:Uncharacterized protein n=1 Tax=Streptomyces mesophilus TaxID=1775132 RepID=A0A6G4XGY1_9ACTN|nr:hypothetical protein [Streptomyces mesophilus]NGO76816.1 hypothetical protein [Streptomyces mesophilus]
MAVPKEPVRIYNAGAPLGVSDGKVFAFMMQVEQEEARVASWKLTEIAGGYQIQDVGTGNYLALPEGYDDGEGNTFGGLHQAVASSDNPKTPNSVWAVTELEPNSRVYTLALAGTGWLLGRNNIEDRTIMPKAVFAGSEGAVTEFIDIQPT